MSETIVIPRRFRGPLTSGNGGYTCGLLAGIVGGEAEVTLRLPPPLERRRRSTRRPATRASTSTPSPGRAAGFALGEDGRKLYARQTWILPR